MSITKYTLPELPFDLKALEPSISGQIMDLHYNRHHKTYVTNLNAALEAQKEAMSRSDLVKQLELQSAIKFNAGGHINHTLFWENLCPSSSGSANITSAAPQLHQALTRRWGSFQKFQSAFETSALAIQGSGWIWLVKDKETGELGLATSKDQDLPPTDKIAVIGVDMWEHAYYIQYFNNKKEYLGKIWQVINWATAEKRFRGDSKVVYGELSGLASQL